MVATPIRCQLIVVWSRSFSAISLALCKSLLQTPFYSCLKVFRWRLHVAYLNSLPTLTNCLPQAGWPRRSNRRGPYHAQTKSSHLSLSTRRLHRDSPSSPWSAEAYGKGRGPLPHYTYFQTSRALEALNVPRRQSKGEIQLARVRVSSIVATRLGHWQAFLPQGYQALRRPHQATSWVAKAFVDRHYPI